MPETAVDMSRMPYYRQVKQCECKGRSTSGRIIFKRTGWTGDQIQMTATLYNCLVCDVCDTPWKFLRPGDAELIG